jgi:predicted nucleic acid-binding Zn ribbon protein
VPEHHKRNPNINCIICNKPIYRRPQQIKFNGRRVFCGSSCYGISQRKEILCIVCGTPIMAGLNKKTCSKNCANINRAGIKYKIGRPRDNIKNQYALKLRLIEKRGDVCERCDYNKTDILQIHHKDRDRSNNNLENLELICLNCHYEEHLLKRDRLNVKI